MVLDVDVTKTDTYDVTIDDNAGVGDDEMVNDANTLILAIFRGKRKQFGFIIVMMAKQ